MATLPIYTINTPLINYFIYKNGSRMNTPLVNGKIHFYRDLARTEEADTYSDISDPLNPVVNTNPIDLSAVGSCPPIYLQDIEYFITIKSEEGGEDATINNYRGATFNQDTNNLNDSTNNLLANGQYSYPIIFNRTDEPVGTIDEPYTNVAFGWYFAQDAGATGNSVTFNNVSNELIEGAPQFEVVVSSTTVTGDTTKYLGGIYGSATSFEGDELTFCIQMVNKNLSGTVPVTISIEKNFGAGGSATIITDIETFDVSGTRSKFTVTFTNPSSVGSTVGTGNYAALRINFPLNQFFSVGATNALLQLGSFEDPIYIGQDFSMEVAQSIGSSTQMELSGLKDNYSQMTYSDGLYFPLSQSGAIIMSAAAIDFPDKLEIETPGQTLPVSGYSEKNIPYSRLFNVIGTTYGSAGDLIVTSNANVVSFTASVGSRQRSAYTNGDIGSGYVIANPVVGLRYEFDLTVDALDDKKVIMTWIAMFAINQNHPFPFNAPIQSGALGNYYRAGTAGYNPSSWGSQALLTTTINPGSGIQQPSASISFVSENLNSYRSFTQEGIIEAGAAIIQVSGNLLDFGINASNNTRGTYRNRTLPTHISPTFSPGLIRFRVDGTFGPMPEFVPGSLLYTIDFNILTSESLKQNVARFVREIANPFVWTITINSAPTAGQYFLYSAGPSDTGTEYYGWYTVNGVGVDPAVGTRTGVEIAILSTDSTAIIAEKTAAAINSLTFDLPTPGTHLPALPSALTSYYINL